MMHKMKVVNEMLKWVLGTYVLPNSNESGSEHFGFVWYGFSRFATFQTFFGLRFYRFVKNSSSLSQVFGTFLQ